MFISEAFAQTVADASAGTGDMVRLVFQLGLIMLIFYILIIRPQKKKYDDQQKMLRGISRGDKIIVGGIIGTVTKTVGDNELIVEIADNTKIKVLRSYVIGMYEEEALRDNSSDGKKGSSEKLKNVLNK